MSRRTVERCSSRWDVKFYKIVECKRRLPELIPELIEIEELEGPFTLLQGSLVTLSFVALVEDALLDFKTTNQC